MSWSFVEHTVQYLNEMRCAAPRSLVNLSAGLWRTSILGLPPYASFEPLRTPVNAGGRWSDLFVVSCRDAFYVDVFARQRVRCADDLRDHCHELLFRGEDRALVWMVTDVRSGTVVALLHVRRVPDTPLRTAYELMCLYVVDEELRRPQLVSAADGRRTPAIHEALLLVLNAFCDQRGADLHLPGPWRDLTSVARLLCLLSGFLSAGPNLLLRHGAASRDGRRCLVAPDPRGPRWSRSRAC